MFLEENYTCCPTWNVLEKSLDQSIQDSDDHDFEENTNENGIRKIRRLPKYIKKNMLRLKVFVSVGKFFHDFFIYDLYCSRT